MNDRNTTILIREIADHKELTVIHRLAETIFPQTYEELLAPEQIPYMMDMMYAMPVLQKEFADEVRFALIFDENTPIGYISWHDQASDGEKLVKLEKLYVDFDYHHCGIGNLGLKFVLNQAKKIRRNRRYPERQQRECARTKSLSAHRIVPVAKCENPDWQRLFHG